MFIEITGQGGTSPFYVVEFRTDLPGVRVELTTKGDHDRSRMTPKYIDVLKPDGAPDVWTYRVTFEPDISVAPRQYAELWANAYPLSGAQTAS